MRYIKQMALLAILMMPLAYSQAQVRIGVGVGFGPAYVAGPPVCEYGYYDYSPYACAPYGYYGPSWFSSGVFIGAGPWSHGYYGRSGWGSHYYGRDYYSSGYYGRSDYGRGDYGRNDRRGFDGRQGREGNEGGFFDERERVFPSEAENWIYRRFFDS